MSDIEQKCRVALQALSDWSVTYAPDMCDPETVEKAKARILQHGTLWYISNATEQLHAVIRYLSEAETREREARREALGDAAEAIFVMGAWYHGFADKGVANNFDEGTSAAYEVVRELHGQAEGALQSEERGTNAP